MNAPNFLNSKFSIAIIAILSVVFFSSCTTTQMTISPQSYKYEVNKINSTIISLSNEYQLTGSGSETKNEIVVTGQSYSQYSGYGTLMDNDYYTYDNYIYNDTLGNTIEIEFKYKRGTDYHGSSYISKIEVTKCICEDKKYYNSVCGTSGFVKKVEQLTPDQQSVFYDKAASTLVGILGGIAGGTIIGLLIFFL